MEIKTAPVLTSDKQVLAIQPLVTHQGPQVLLLALKGKVLYPTMSLP